MSRINYYPRWRRLWRLLAIAALVLAAQGRSAAQDQPNQQLLKDINPGAAASDPQQLTSMGNRVFFTAATQANGRELWTSDGTEAGTRLVADLTPGPAGSTITAMTVANGSLLFLRQTDSGFEMRRSDGDSTTPIATVIGQHPGSQIVIGADGAYFLTQTTVDGGVHRLWRTGGTAASTAPLADRQGGGLITITNLHAVGGRVYVSFQDNGVRRGTTDYTYFNGSGFTKLESCSYNSISSDCVGTAAWGDRLVIGKNESPRLVLARGVITQTLDLSSLPITELRTIASLGERLIFAAKSPDGGMWLWRTDGTLSGTERVSRLGPAQSVIEATSSAHGLLYVEHRPDVSPTSQLWQTDGTAAGTRRISGPGQTGFAGVKLAGAANDQLLIFADDGVHGYEPWQIASRDAAPSLIGDIEPGPGSSMVLSPQGTYALAAVEGGFIWNATNQATGAEPRYMALGFAPYTAPAWAGGPPGGLATAPVILGNRSADSQPVTITLTLPAGVSLVRQTLGVTPTIAGDTVRWTLASLPPTSERTALLTFRLPEAALGDTFTATLSLEPGGASAPIRLEIAHQHYLPALQNASP